MQEFRTKLDMNAVRAEWALESDALLQRGFELPFLENGKIYFKSRSGILEASDDSENKTSNSC
jgi:hypothetical protein